MTRVVLQTKSLWYPCFIGTMRKTRHKVAAFEGKKRPDKNQERGGKDLDSWDEIESACAEYAVAQTINRHWPGDFWTKQKTIDIPPDIEVRWSKHENGHLLLYLEDNPDFKYVFVTGALPEYFIHGWIFGREGMLKEHYGQLRSDRPPCFRIPEELLRSIDELKPAAHSQPYEDIPVEGPAWIPCPCCDNFFCTIHEMHAHDCECPPIEEWSIDPYAAGGRLISGN